MRILKLDRYGLRFVFFGRFTFDLHRVSGNCGVKWYKECWIDFDIMKHFLGYSFFFWYWVSIFGVVSDKCLNSQAGS